MFNPSLVPFFDKHHTEPGSILVNGFVLEHVQGRQLAFKRLSHSLAPFFDSNISDILNVG